MKIFFDTEFIEDGKTIDLISIGMVREDGLAYYAENRECDLAKANRWVKENVLEHLKGGNHLANRLEIADEIKRFVGKDPEFWAYYADYDWVALCQLYGTMMDLPKGWPMYCRDLKQLQDENFPNFKYPSQEGTEHNALDDAKHNRKCYLEMTTLKTLSIKTEE